MAVGVVIDDDGENALLSVARSASMDLICASRFCSYIDTNQSYTADDEH